MIKKEDVEKYGETGKVIMLFQEIDKIPRDSGNERGIVEYLKKFAIERGLEYYADDFRNIIIRKAATNGMNNSIAFQSHTDMVCEKREGSKHDFTTDPIQLLIDGDYIKSNETSIGADNGIGVAYMLAMLDSNNLEHPNLEMLFTAEEETVLSGAKNIDLSKIKSERIISFDAFSEDIINIGCASCLERTITFDTIREPIVNMAGKTSYVIKISGFVRRAFWKRYR